MSGMRKVLVAIGVLLLLYPVVLIILGYVLAGQVEERVRTRLSYALRADDIAVDDVSVSLLRGRIEVEGIHAKRTSMGLATVDIGELTIEVAGLGMALFDDTVQLVDVHDAHLQLSAVGAATLRQGDGPPLEVGELTMSDSSVTLLATSFFPSVGKARLGVNRAHAEDLVLNNAMSWLYKTDTLDATVQVPGDLSFGLLYADKEMSVSGSILGSQPITIPFSWPIPDPRDLELEQILDLAKSLSKRIATEYAKRKASGLWDDVTGVLE